MTVALFDAAMIMGSAAAEAASLLWMELAMFAAAGIIYLVFVRGAAQSSLGTKMSALVKNSSRPSARKDVNAPSQRQNVPDSNHIYQQWEKLKLTEQAAEIDLAGVLDAMRKVGKSAEYSLAEIEAALDSNTALLPNVEALPAALLRDGAVELVGAAVAMLEKRGRTPDSAVYAGLLSSLLRRRDLAGVASVAAKMPSTSMTPKIRAVLAAAAAQHGRLDEALGHIRQLPVPPENTKCLLPPSVVALVLQLAAKDTRAAEAAKELKRVQGILEARHLHDLLDERRGANSAGGAASAQSRSELWHAVAALQVPRSAGMYLAVARALAFDADAVGLQELLREIEASQAKEEELGADAVRDVIVVEALALALLDASKAVKGEDLALRVLKLYSDACAGAPGARVLAATCSALAACDRQGAACDFYEKEMAPKGAWPDAALSATLLKAAAHLGRTALAKRLADHVGSMRISGSHGANAEIQRHATMIKAHARERDLNAAKAVFARLRASGTTLPPLIFNALLDALVQCGDDEGALKHFEEMKHLKYLDVVGYNTMLKGYLGRGLTEEACALIQEMATSGLQPNKVTYNELLHSKVLARDVRGIWEIVEEMHKAGLKANPVTCSILLKSLSSQSSLEDVMRVTSLIDEVEEQIDDVLFSSVIEACIRIKQLDLLSDLMRRHRNKGTFTNLTVPTYGAMIKAYGQAGDVGRVRELWQEMDERGVKPTAITIGCMVEALVTNWQADEAWQLVHKACESEDTRACINTVVYSTVLKGFAVEKRLDKVFAVYEEMKAKGIACNTITYNTMLDACAKCSAMDRASTLMQHMKEFAVEPDIITYSTILKGYCMEGDVNRAFQVLEEMKKDDKFTPDEIMYNSILDGCAKEHRVDDALKLLDEMNAAGIRPSNYTLSILVKLLGHARRLPQAFHMVEDMSKKYGFRPNVQVYTCMVQACVMNRRLDQALQLHGTMLADSGCRVDEKFYAVLAKGCLQMHQPLKAVEVVRAAYQLPGHSLTSPARRGPPVGVESRALDEIVGKLKAGGQEEQHALDALAADLLEHRNLRLSDGSRQSAPRAGANYRRRPGPGLGGGGGGR